MKTKMCKICTTVFIIFTPVYQDKDYVQKDSWNSAAWREISPWFVFAFLRECEQSTINCIKPQVMPNKWYFNMKMQLN